MSLERFIVKKIADTIENATVVDGESDADQLPSYCLDEMALTVSRLFLFLVAARRPEGVAAPVWCCKKRPLRSLVMTAAASFGGDSPLQALPRP